MPLIATTMLIQSFPMLSFPSAFHSLYLLVFSSLLSPLEVIASSHLCLVLQIYFGPESFNTAEHGGCQPYLPVLCCPAAAPHPSLLLLYTSLNNFLPSFLPVGVVSLRPSYASPSFCFPPLSLPFSLCPSLLPWSFSRYIFSGGGVRHGISLLSGVHQCQCAKIQPGRLCGGTATVEL